MTEPETSTTEESDASTGAELDASGAFSKDFIEEVVSLIEAGDREALEQRTESLYAADIADLLEQLSPDQRVPFVVLSGDAFDFTVLTEVDDTIRERLLQDLPSEFVAQGLRELESDDAVYILEDLDEADQAEILDKIPEFERLQLSRSLEYPEESAGRRMSTEFIAVPPFWTVGQTIDYMRETDDLPEEFYELYVVDPAFHLQGTVTLNHILRAKRPVQISELMDSDPITVKADEDQEEVGRMFDRYDLVSVGVIDEDQRLVGIITVDDIVDVITEEVEEDIRRLSGVGDEEMTDTVWYTARSRFIWLLINLATAVLASLVIGLFDATIEQMVALAILMPIVASMGGNAGTQTMTVAVRALATRELGGYNAARIVSREMLVGLLNGTGFAIIIGAVTWAWFGSAPLGGVIAFSMVLNMVVAGLSGIVIPLALNKFGADPAVASGVFLTTVTDVVGFFAFLGLAAALLL
ncbi:magnesium transporter [Tepidamorphus sp. 3E244]|uniref:magnesium transporter n=1 Tax=Tepidamorphus sp. 3E244 TaxID=3385498 RepID=UPI0038FCBBB7